jgi:hypothetical protein
VKILLTASLALLVLITAGCGSSANTTPVETGALTGNWQFNLSQEVPRPPTTVSISGFLQQSETNLAGSVSVPQAPSGSCGGVVALTGVANGQNVNFSVNQNGTVLTFVGTIDFSTTSMSGTYSGPAGSCFNKATSGTWSAFLVPSISGSFTGNLANSQYMEELTGQNPPTPIAVSGTLTQSPNTQGGSNASVTGTITATGYPCMSSGTLVGTVSGQNLILDVYSYEGEQIGYLGGGNSGSPVTICSSNNPACTTSSSSSGISLSGPFALGGTSTAGSFGPCPPIPIKFDTATACLAISPAVCATSTSSDSKSK